MKYLRRLLYNARGERYNPLMYPFFIATLAYGIGFAFFGASPGVESSSLFAAMHGLQTALPQVWGAVALGAIALNFLTLILRKEALAHTTAFLGCMVWIFASFIYLLGGDYLVLVSVTVPNLLFWVWYWLYLGSNGID